MGHKWLEAFSKAVTYLGSGVTALTGTMQAAQQQEQIDAAWAALLHTRMRPSCQRHPLRRPRRWTSCETIWSGRGSPPGAGVKRPGAARRLR